MYKHLYTFLISSICILTATTNTYANDVFAYPTGSQSMEQQQKDQFQCHQWSASQTGFDPGNTSQQNYAYAPSQGSYQSGGAIAGDAGKGAAIGALAGGLFGGIRRSNRRAEEQRWQQQAQQAQMQQQARNNFNCAYSVCMSSRNYKVQ